LKAQTAPQIPPEIPKDEGEDEKDDADETDLLDNQSDPAAAGEQVVPEQVEMASDNSRIVSPIPEEKERHSVAKPNK
jgi:hypothetical protein